MLELKRPNKTNEAIAYLLSKFDFTMMNKSMGYLEWDIRSGMIYWDPAWATLFGISSGVYCGNAGDWEDLIHPDDLPEVIDTLNEHLCGNTPFFLAEYRLAKCSEEKCTIKTCGIVVTKSSLDRPVWAVMISQYLSA